MYCTAAHRRIHANHGHLGEECNRMLEQVKRRSQVLHDPLKFNLSTAVAVCDWLKAQRLHIKPLWNSLCPLHSSALGSVPPPPSSSYSDNGSDPMDPSTTLPQTHAEWEAAWQLSPSSLIPSFHSSASPSNQGSNTTPSSSPASSLPHDWPTYYQYRQIQSPSPAALVLSHVVTLWYCLTQLLPSHGHLLPPAGSQITIHYLGKEIHNMEVCSCGSLDTS
jgi:hypothetical protein